MSRKHCFWEMPTWGRKDMCSYPIVQIGAKQAHSWHIINLFLKQYRKLQRRQTNLQGAKYASELWWDVHFQ